MNEGKQDRILVVDDEPHIGESIKDALERVGYAVDVSLDAEAALARLDRDSFDLVLCDIKLPGMDGYELLRRVKEFYPELDVVMITGYASIESAVASVKEGAADYLSKPFTPEQVRHAVVHALERRHLVQENLVLRGELRHLLGDQVVVGQSESMQQLFDLAHTVAATDSSVLITGESGTGKEVLARFIHAASPRGQRPFVTVNCAAIPPNLLESELFGHRRGAFTGAIYSRRGSFELADRGTLFLDEIGEMPTDMQGKILRALEEHQIKPIGSEEAVRVDVRILAATNKNLAEEIRANRFREDLYWRLNVVQLAIPPLRERRQDVLPLAQYFLDVFAQELKKPIAGLSPDVVEAFSRYDWPGNVRELRNAIERAVIFAEPRKPLRVAHLPPSLRQQTVSREGARSPVPFRSLREVENDYIRQILAACGGNRTRAAEILGISPVTLWRKLGKEHDADDSPEGKGDGL
ncbi:MAG: sigma-54-dependent Fis family transcriptional regulator [Gemmatimonadetes bacterium]|nr:sigma-54-dependent Fis family transcriptional regulator [Gemmatimonadota bacterium]